MENKIFLSTKNKLVEINGDELKINGVLLKEKQGDETIEYKLSPEGMDEATLTKKALEVSQSYYIKSLEKLISAEKLLVLTGAGSSKDDELFGGKLMWELWDFMLTLQGGNYNFNTFLNTIGIDENIKSKKDLETVLSKAKLYLEFNNNENIAWHVAIIESWILNLCNFSLFF